MYRGESSGTEFDLMLDKEDIHISADAGRIRQLMHNLIRNALDAMKSETNTDNRLSIRTLSDRQNSLLLLEFEDTGPGFDDRIIDNVFEPYVTTKQHGTGLGLAIVNKIVEEHNGTIKVQNLANGGARICITFSYIDSQARVNQA